MKKSGIFSLLFLSLVFLSSCVKNEEVIYENNKLAEIDAASWNANSAGVTYPILTRIGAGRPVSTSVDSVFRRISNMIRVRVNLVGPQSDKEETVGYKTFGSPITTINFPATITGQTPAQSSGTLSVLTAIAGTHYTALSGKVTIPAKSSFGFIEIPVLNPGATAGEARFLGIQLDSTGSVLPSPNYNKVGIVIDQR